MKSIGKFLEFSSNEPEKHGEKPKLMGHPSSFC